MHTKHPEPGLLRKRRSLRKAGSTAAKPRRWIQSDSIFSSLQCPKTWSLKILFQIEPLLLFTSPGEEAQPMRDSVPTQGCHEFRVWWSLGNFCTPGIHCTTQRFDKKQHEHSKHNGCRRGGVPFSKAPGAPGEGCEPHVSR